MGSYGSQNERFSIHDLARCGEDQIYRRTMLSLLPARVIFLLFYFNLYSCSAVVLNDRLLRLPLPVHNTARNCINCLI